MGDKYPVSIEDPATGQFQVVGEADIEETKKGEFVATIFLDPPTSKRLFGGEKSPSVSVGPIDVEEL